MRTKFLLPVLLMMIISGLITTSSIPNPTSVNPDGYYDIASGRIHCSDVWVCLHEVVHKIDYNGMLDPTISTTKEFHQAVTDYQMKVYEITVENRSYLQSYIYNFPGVGNEFREDGWGGFHELYAQIFRVSQELNLDIPDEFVRFYDREEIYKLWEQTQNSWSN